MTPARAKQRQRILRARTVSERIARIDHLSASNARSAAETLAARLAREIADGGVTAGPMSGQMLAARAALAERLRRAAGSMAQRQADLSANEALAATRSLAARQARRSAEHLAEQADRAAEAQRERRLALSPRRKEPRLP